MKNKKIKNIVLIFVILFLLLILGYAKINSSNYLDNFLIFNLYENQENANNKYFFDISPGISKTANISLYSTFDTNGLANTKIAPGTSGEFEILLKTSEKLKYQIRFDSKNTKPQNLVFNIKGESEKYNKLENLEEKLRGTLNKDETREIIIQWNWEYETNKQGNIQDTLDGKNIIEYNFEIKVLSYEV